MSMYNLHAISGGRGVMFREIESVALSVDLTSTCPPELAVEPVSKAGGRQPRSKTKGEGHIDIKQLVVTESGHEPIRASRHRYDDQEHTL